MTIRYILFVFSFLCLFSCSEDDGLSIIEKEKGNVTVKFTSINASSINQDSPSRSRSNSDYDITNGGVSAVSFVPNTISFENWVNGVSETYDPISLSPEQIVNKEATIDLNIGTYSLFASSLTPYKYKIYTLGSTEVSREIDIKHYGKLNPDPLIVSIDNEEKVGEMHMEIINAPMVFRFEQLCNHPDEGESNPHWYQTRNKLVEYIVEVKSWNRKKGHNFVSSSSDFFGDDSYDDYLNNKYYIYVLFHDIYVFKESGELLKHNTIENLSNKAVYDFILDGCDKSEVSIKFRRRELKVSSGESNQGDISLRDCRYYERYTYSHVLNVINGYANYDYKYYQGYFDDENYYRVYDENQVHFYYNNTWYKRVAKYKNYQGHWVYKYKYLNRSYDEEYWEKYSSNVRLEALCSLSLYEHFKLIIKEQYGYNKNKKSFVSVEINGSEWIKSERAKFKKYRIVVGEWDGRTKVSQKESSSNISNTLDIQCIQEHTINLNN